MNLKRDSRVNFKITLRDEWRLGRVHFIIQISWHQDVAKGEYQTAGANFIDRKNRNSSPSCFQICLKVTTKKCSLAVDQLFWKEIKVYFTWCFFWNAADASSLLILYPSHLWRVHILLLFTLKCRWIPMLPSELYETEEEATGRMQANRIGSTVKGHSQVN